MKKLFTLLLILIAINSYANEEKLKNLPLQTKFQTYKTNIKLYNQTISWWYNCPKGPGGPNGWYMSGSKTFWTSHPDPIVRELERQNYEAYSEYVDGLLAYLHWACTDSPTVPTIDWIE